MNDIRKQIQNMTLIAKAGNTGRRGGQQGNRNAAGPHKPGDRVSHPKYGEGLVTGANEQHTFVNFDNANPVDRMLGPRPVPHNSLTHITDPYKENDAARERMEQAEREHIALQNKYAKIADAGGQISLPARQRLDAAEKKYNDSIAEWKQAVGRADAYEKSPEAPHRRPIPHYRDDEDVPLEHFQIGQKVRLAHSIGSSDWGALHEAGSEVTVSDVSQHYSPQAGKYVVHGVKIKEDSSGKYHEPFHFARQK